MQVERVFSFEDECKDTGITVRIREVNRLSICMIFFKLKLNWIGTHVSSTPECKQAISLCKTKTLYSSIF